MMIMIMMIIMIMIIAILMIMMIIIIIIITTCNNDNNNFDSPTLPQAELLTTKAGVSSLREDQARSRERAAGLADRVLI